MITTTTTIPELRARLRAAKRDLTIAARDLVGRTRDDLRALRAENRVRPVFLALDSDMTADRLDDAMRRYTHYARRVDQIGREIRLRS